MFKFFKSSKKTEVSYDQREILSNLWDRYVCETAGDRDSFVMTGEEYGIVLRYMHRDPRAAAMYFDLRVKVAADQLVDTAAPLNLSESEKHCGEVMLEGVKYEVACMRFKGEIAGYPDNVLNYSDADWDSFDFVRESDAEGVSEYVRDARVAALRIPDHSNITEISDMKPTLAIAN